MENEPSFLRRPAVRVADQPLRADTGGPRGAGCLVGPARLAVRGVGHHGRQLSVRAAGRTGEQSTGAKGKEDDENKWRAPANLDDDENPLRECATGPCQSTGKGKGEGRVLSGHVPRALGLLPRRVGRSRTVGPELDWGLSWWGFGLARGPRTQHVPAGLVRQFVSVFIYCFMILKYF
jgi:hypothetical protein